MGLLFLGPSFLGSLEALPSLEKLSFAAHLLLLLFLLLTPASRVFNRVLSRVKARADSGGGVGDPVTFVVGCWFKVSIFCSVYIVFLQLAVLGYETVILFRDGVKDYSVFYLPCLETIAWLAITFRALQSWFNAAAKFPLPVRFSWPVSFCLCLYIGFVDTRGFLDKFTHLNSHVVANYAAAPALAFLSIASIRGISGIDVYRVNSDLHDPLLTEEDEAGCPNVTPYSGAGIFSLATLSWLSPLLSIGAKRPLELRDVPLLAHKDRSKTSYKALNSNCAENPGKTYSLALAIFLSFWKEAMVNAVFAGLYTLVSFVGPYLISYFVDYLSGNVAFLHEGYVLTSVFFVAKLVETVTTRQWYLGLDVLGMHVKSALTALVYKKGLRLSCRARQRHTIGDIVNYIAVDVEKVSDCSWNIHDIWLLPLQITLALAILYKHVGIASVATLGATIICIAIAYPFSELQKRYQVNLMAAKDDRMRTTSECLRNMRILKFQAWEVRYRLKLEEMRNAEYSWIRKTVYSQALVTFIYWGSPIFISVATFATCILLGGQLTAGSVLSVLATIRILQDPLKNFPDLVLMISQTKVAVERITDFLQQEELQVDATVIIPSGLASTAAIEIKDGEFCWDPESSKPTLSSIQLKVEKGKRVAVCGAVGSGKSSFLSCILGEIPKISGEVRISGSAAYVSQSAWIQSGNIEENILFGSPMDEQRYKNVINACSLKRDLELFSHGDQTIIGDRGINLSGGQKQRVQLARALYQDADIYLLDDPFSAVDAHTGSDLFKEYILTALASKTVVFVTHQVEFLPAADLILVLKEGHIIQAGKYDDILKSGTDFNALVSAHQEAIEAMDIPECMLEDVSMLRQRSGSIVSKADSLGSKTPENKPPSERIGVKEMKKSKCSGKKQLVQEEERARGRVGLTVYLSYMAAAYKGALIPLIILSQTTFQVLQIASNWWMASANPQTHGDKPKTTSTYLLDVYMALAFGSSLFVFLKAVLVATFGLEASQKLFLKMLKTIFRAPMSFFDSTPMGRILNRVSVDQSVVDLDIPNRLGSFATTLIQLLGIIGVMSKVTWQVLLLLFPMTIVCLWMQKYYMASSSELVRMVSIQKSPIINLFGESIAGASTIRGFGQEKRFIKRNLYLLDCYSRPFFYSKAAIQWLCLRMELLSTFVFAFCMTLLVSLPHGSIDPSMAGLAVTYGINLNARFSRWILSFCKLENKIVSIERIQQFCDIPSEAPAIIDDSRPPPWWPGNGKIELLDLQARYKENLPIVLRGVTCTFPGGKKIGIVGRTGSGKSTLIQALFRLIEPTHGKIIIDDIDISTIGLHDLRSRLSIIPQDPTLFEGTIRGNLDPLEEHYDYEVWQALDKCQLREAIRQKKQKLDSPVLENGENWSVGQRQLIALGRALLKRARILVLDEATASVDTATDNLIQQVIRREFKDCTVCTIAHRIPTVVDSDFILVLNEGKVAEFDRPQKLLEDKTSMFMRLASEYSIRSSCLADA
ncbi:ABC transporter C family member 5 [Phalaenopsis equestris]|uniref:ABC transporter C family member 5 n=1 Tax=Phalaenopsis equestris TaxID=78828 RepID=UPI0009E60650|nr:ABC transporter C family member 5 [Phalaenopsis equestris]